MDVIDWIPRQYRDRLRSQCRTGVYIAEVGRDALAGSAGGDIRPGNKRELSRGRATDWNVKSLMNRGRLTTDWLCQ